MSKKKSTKPRILIVHGARTRSGNPSFNNVLVQIKRCLNYEPYKYRAEQDWIAYFYNKGYEVRLFSWSGNVFAKSRKHACNQLIKQITQIQPDAIIALSLGSEIAACAQQTLKHTIPTICIAPVFRMRNLSLVCIHSFQDYFARVGTKLLWPVRGGFSKQNVLLTLENRGHHEFEPPQIGDIVLSQLSKML